MSAVGLTGTPASRVLQAVAAVQQQAWRCCLQQPRQHASRASAAKVSQQVRVVLLGHPMGGASSLGVKGAGD